MDSSFAVTGVAAVIRECRTGGDSSMACILCGDRAGSLYVNETWAGTLHSACNHIACEDCLRTSINADLPRCRDECLLRVRCFAPGCLKMLPQTLVLHISNAARGLAMEIDRQNHDDQEHYKGLPIDWLPRTCAVCNDYQGPTLECRTCSYSACELCTGRWVDMQLARCTAQRELAPQCFNPECGKRIEEDVALFVSPSAKELKRALGRRKRLSCNSLYPASVQVDCPRPGCVGLGYLGFDTVMCFICEHQWSALDGDAPEDGLPEALKVKDCPKCHAQIEKNGGCDHMTCRCGHEFYWTTLLPFRQ